MKRFFIKVKDALLGRAGRGTYIIAAVVAIATVLNVIVYMLTTRFGLYLYSPQKDDLSLTGNTDKLFAEAIAEGKSVSIVFCDAEEKVKTNQIGSFVYRTATSLAEKYPELITLKFVNIITGTDEGGARFDVNKYTKDMLGNETPIRKSSVIFTSGENWRVITDTATSVGYSDFFTLDASGNAFSYNGEEVLASMAAWVLSDEHKVAYFTQGHGETADVAFSNMLACAGYYVDVINLKKQEIPENAGLIIISNPISDFEMGGEGIITEIERLRSYVKGGGNLYVALDPYVRELPQLRDFLTECGVTVADSKTDGGVYSRELVKDTNMAISTDGLAFIASFGDGAIANKISQTVSAYGTGSVLISDACRLSLSGKAEGILYSSASSVTVSAGTTFDRSGNYCVAAVGSLSDAQSGSEGHVFVIPCVFLTSGDVLAMRGYSNKDFVYAVLTEALEADTAPYGCNSVVYNTGALENLTMGTARLYAVLLIAIPALLGLSGAVIIIRRRNR